MLTLDLGNRRAKLRRWDAHGVLVRALDQPHGACLSPPAEDLWSASRALLSSVASEGVVRRWTAWAHELGLEWHVPVPQLELRVSEPASVGHDRLFAAAGALLERPAAVVVDVGTALTVDAAGDGAFLGGAIAPGAELGARALHDHAALLPAIEPEPTRRALGGDTRSALQAGIVLGLRGAASALVARAAQEAGFDLDVPVVLTGGARALLLEPEPFTTRPIVVEPDLVHRGLLAAAAAGR
ncbi:MAG: type III pantothenate kinase [Planctomycetota bacterium]